MNAKTVKLNNVSVVIGLEWELLDAGASEHKAKRDILKRNPGVKAGVLVRSVVAAVLGLLPPSQKKPSVPSGAALLALANQQAQLRGSVQSSGVEDNQWIVIERLGEDEYWVVDIKDGVPLPGSDFVGDLDKVRNYLADTVGGTNFKVFSSDEVVLRLAGLDTTTVHRGAGDIIADLEKPSRANLKPLSGLDPVVLIVIAAIVVGLVGYFGWAAYEKQARAQAAQMAAAQRATADARKLSEEKKNYVAAIEAAVIQALDAGVANVDAALQTSSPEEVLMAWSGMVEAVPLDHSGWATDRIECALESPTQPVCTVVLKRTPLSINRILLEDYPDAEIVANEASYVIRGPELVPRVANWSQLGNARALMIGLMSDLQFVRSTGLNYSQGESQDITQAVTLPAPPPSLFKPGDPKQATAPAPINTGVAKGQLGLSGQGLWQLQGLSTLIDQQGVAVVSLTVSLTGVDQTWNAEAEFFLRSLPAPVLPVIVGPDGPISVALPERYKALAGGLPTQGGVDATEGLPLPDTAGPVEETSTNPPQDPALTDPAGPISLGLPDAPPSVAPAPTGP